MQEAREVAWNHNQGRFTAPNQPDGDEGAGATQGRHNAEKGSLRKRKKKRCRVGFNRRVWRWVPWSLQDGGSIQCP